jgi:hypothetical protein
MLFASISGENHQRKYRRDDAASIQTLWGTLIHNGKCGTPPAIRSLSVALIKSSFQRFPVAEVCSSSLLTACFGSAMLAAVLLAMIAATAYPEYGVTSLPTAKPLAENIFRNVSHSHLKARLDNGCRACQRNGGCLENLSTERNCQWTPVADTIGVSSCSTLRKKLHDYRDDVICACGAMMLRGLFRRMLR